MSKADDGHLWKAYETAVASGDLAAVSAAGSDIVRHHMPFFIGYVNETAFRQWPYHVRRDYLADVLVVVAEKIPTYDRRARFSGGRTASFVTYVKPYLQLIRYRIEGGRTPMRLGHETMRFAMEARYFVAARLGAGFPHPSAEEVADALTLRFGKRISPDRVARLLSIPQAVDLFGYDPAAGETFVLDEVEDRVTETEVVTDPAEIVADADEREWLARRVREALDSLDLDALDWAVVELRLMAEERRTIEALAVDFGVTELEVIERERVLRRSLAQLLS
jgi:hypothetical protein